MFLVGVEFRKYVFHHQLFHPLFLPVSPTHLTTSTHPLTLLLSPFPSPQGYVMEILLTLDAAVDLLCHSNRDFHMSTPNLTKASDKKDGPLTPKHQVPFPPTHQQQPQSLTSSIHRHSPSQAYRKNIVSSPPVMANKGLFIRFHSFINTFSHLFLLTLSSPTHSHRGFDRQGSRSKKPFFTFIRLSSPPHHLSSLSHHFTKQPPQI